METGNKLLWFRRHPFVSLVLVTAILAAGLLSTAPRVAVGSAEFEQLVELPLAPLSSVAVPSPVGGDIVDQAAAVRLGKALFWDVQVGGDGQTSCATCHFRGGADQRTFNTLNPGPDGIFDSGGVTAAGQEFHPSNIVNEDRVASQGLVGLKFVGIDPNSANAADICTPVVTAPFFENRRTTTRNAPTTTNGLVFFRQIFLDGRGNELFNGVNPFGHTANQTANLTPNPAATAIGNSPLASQAVGPANRHPEMGCANATGNIGTSGRAFNGANSLAAKMLARPALQHQVVHRKDRVLGDLSNAGDPQSTGMTCGRPANPHPCMYGELITAAFGANITNPLTQFSRIFGQAIQAYEATLIPDQTPLDKLLAGNSNALTGSQKKGLSIFGGKGKCIKCHAGAELTDASVRMAALNGLINEDFGDQGFHNIGVRPTAEDLGRGALGPGGVQFSESHSAMDSGAFKTPALRNVKLTAPYFHNGGKATLADVVDFYNRGGDFNNTEKARRIRPLGLKAAEQAALVDFLTNALTDCRVEHDEAPFDHPSLKVPNGRVVNGLGADLELAETGGVTFCQ
jgi:cytochrome c peroxidase